MERLNGTQSYSSGTVVDTAPDNSLLQEAATQPRSYEVQSYASPEDDFANEKLGETPPSINSDPSDSPPRKNSWKALLPIQRTLSSIIGEPVGLHDTSPKQWKSWKVNLIRFGPLSGVFCMLLAIASIFASLGILAGSRGKPVDSWVATPSTYLAICTAVANLAMRYACIQGVCIAWWTRAMRGSSVARLHYDWYSGTSLRGALTSGRYTGLLALACIVSTVVVVDGPFLQRASTVRFVPRKNDPVNLHVKMVEEIPRDYTGFWLTARQAGEGRVWGGAFNRTNIPTAVNGTGPNNIFSAPYGNGILKYYTENWLVGGKDLAVEFLTGCPDVCNATVRAPALATTSCRSFLTPVNYTQNGLGDGFLDAEAAPPLSLAALIIDISLQLQGGHESIDLVTAYAHSSKGIGELNITACNMVSAIGEYDVVVRNDPPTLSSSWNPRIVALANNTAVNYSIEYAWHPSTLGGLADIAYWKWFAEVLYYSGEDGQPGGISFAHVLKPAISLDVNFSAHQCGWLIQGISSDARNTNSALKSPQANLQCLAGLLANEMAIQPGNQLYDNFDDWVADGKTDTIAQKDPRPLVLPDLNKLMFVTGLYASANEPSSYLQSHVDPGVHISSNITGQRQGHHNVFHTDFNWFVAAAIVEFGCILLVLPTYWGWWTLGRPVSFSPIVLAKAFDAPVFADCNSNSSGQDIARELRDTRIQYGITKCPDGRTKLAFASAEVVERPMKHMTVDV